MRIGFVLLFGWLGALTAWAAPDSVKLTFPAQAEYLVWVQSESETFLTDRATNIQGTSGEVKVVAAGEKPSVYVLDGKTNLLAVKPLGEVKDAAWTLKKEDFTRIARLDLTAETSKGKVASGLFRVKTGDQTRTALLTPDDKGRVTLWNLPPGPVEVVFETKSGEKTLATSAQRVELSREAGRVGVLVTADDAAPVVEQEKDPATGQEPGAAAPAGARPGDAPAQRASGGGFADCEPADRPDWPGGRRGCHLLAAEVQGRPGARLFEAGRAGPSRSDRGRRRPHTPRGHPAAPRPRREDCP
ncbi:MAG TPA: hypothetical protein PLB31_02770 [Fimbriimonadaceae bacterium]|nr:hypothetical protein [Fimbriimonadaceae bacterium]